MAIITGRVQDKKIRRTEILVDEPFARKVDGEWYSRKTGRKLKRAVIPLKDALIDLSKRGK